MQYDSDKSKRQKGSPENPPSPPGVDMSVQSKEIRIAAIERSLLDLDRLLENGIEHMTLGYYPRAGKDFTQFLSGLDQRFGGSGKNIPIDVVTRRFRVLINLAELKILSGAPDEAPAYLIEANALAKGTLTEFPEFTAQSDFELCKFFHARGDIVRMKKYLDEANAVSKANPDPYLTFLVRFAGSLLYSAATRHTEAINMISGAAEILEDSNKVEHQLLRAELHFHHARQLSIIKADDDAASMCSKGIELLIGCAVRAVEDGRTFDALRLLMLARKHDSDLPRNELNTFTLAELYIVTASVLNIRGRWALALKNFERAADVLRTTGYVHPKLYSTALLGMSDVCIAQKDYSRAASFLEHALSFGEKHNDNFCFASCHFFLGLNTSKSGNDEKAFDHLKQALDTVKELGYARQTNRLTARVHNQLGFILSKSKDMDEAVTNIQTSIDVLRDFPNDPALGEAYRIMGEIHCRRSQHIQSEQALRKALDIFERLGAVYDCARCYKSLGENALNAGDMNTANFFFEESIRILEELGIESELPMVYSAKARVCIMQEDIEEAEKLYKKDYEIAKKSDNATSLAFSHFQLGRVCRLQRRMHSAEDYLKKSLLALEKVENNAMAAHAMIELSLCLSARRDVKTATDLCAKAQMTFEQMKSQGNMARALLVRGIILRDTKDPRRRGMAQRFMEDSIHLLEKINKVNVELAEAYMEYAIYWREAKDRKNSVEYLTQAIDLCKRLGLTRKADSYITLLQQISPEDATKLRFSSLVDSAAVEQLSKASGKEGVTVDRKNLSILFTDIRNFTTISETLELGKLTSFLNDFYNDVSQSIHRNRGSINKFIGDAVMAIFNMDGKLENHTEMAVRAAVALSRAIRETNLIRRKRGEIDINIGIGINTGTVLVGNFGSTVRQDFTAIGDAVNVASRMQNMAKDGEIILSQTVYDIVKDIVDAEDLGEVSLKGKGEPMRLWKLLNIKD